MKYVFTITLFISLAIVRAFAQTEKDQPVITDTTGIQVNYAGDDKIYDFGEVKRYESATWKFQYRNPADSTLVITDIYGLENDPKGPGYTLKFTWSHRAVKPRRKVWITMTCISQGDKGSFENDIYVSSNLTPEGYPLMHVRGEFVAEAGNIIEGEHHSPGFGEVLEMVFRFLWFIR